MLSFEFDRAKLFARNFSNYSTIVNSGISLPVFPSRINLKLHIISVIPKLVIANLDVSKETGLTCIPKVVLKNCQPELSCILAKLFNMCFEKSCFPDCWKASSVVLTFMNIGGGLWLKKHPVRP